MDMSGEIVKETPSLKYVMNHIDASRPSVIVLALADIVPRKQERRLDFLERVVAYQRVVSQVISFAAGVEYLYVVASSLAPRCSPATFATLRLVRSQLSARFKPTHLMDVSNSLEKDVIEASVKISAIATRTFGRYTPVYKASSSSPEWRRDSFCVASVDPPLMPARYLDSFDSSLGPQQYITLLCQLGQLGEDPSPSYLATTARLRVPVNSVVGEVKSLCLQKFRRLVAENVAKELEADSAFYLAQTDGTWMEDEHYLASYSFVFDQLPNPSVSVMVCRSNSNVCRAASANIKYVPLAIAANYVQEGDYTSSVGIAPLALAPEVAKERVMETGQVLDICVVGGDLAGITAAMELEQLGHRVTLLLEGETATFNMCRANIMGNDYDLDFATFSEEHREYCYQGDVVPTQVQLWGRQGKGVNIYIGIHSAGF